MGVVSLEGISNGRRVDVDGDNRLLVSLDQIADPVQTTPSVQSATPFTAPVYTHSSEVLSARTNRSYIDFQNVGSTRVHFALADSTYTVTTSDRYLEPGQVFTLGGVVSCPHAVQALAIGADSALAGFEVAS